MPLASYVIKLYVATCSCMHAGAEKVIILDRRYSHGSCKWYTESAVSKSGGLKLYYISMSRSFPHSFLQILQVQHNHWLAFHIHNYIYVYDSMYIWALSEQFKIKRGVKHAGFHPISYTISCYHGSIIATTRGLRPRALYQKLLCWWFCACMQMTLGR